jgi:VanZ family protein
MEKIRFLKNIMLYAAVAAGVVLLFVGGPGSYASRSAYHFWNLGHIILFSILSYVVIKDVPVINRSGFWKQLLIMFLLTAVIGIITEVVQGEYDRSPDIKDIVRDLIGSAIALAFFIRSRQMLAKPVLLIMQVLVFLAFVRETYPLGRDLIDETIARSQFPILADFETPFETDRWLEKWRMERDAEIARQGDYSVKAALIPAKYSGVSLRYFPSYWSGYNYLNFSIYNPDSDTLKIICRIHDREHNNAYSDRFKRAYMIRPGWNDIRIATEDIRTAPRNRRMDMHHIKSLVIFTVDLQVKRYIYLDDFHLTQ